MSTRDEDKAIRYPAGHRWAGQLLPEHRYMGDVIRRLQAWNLVPPDGPPEPAPPVND